MGDEVDDDRVADEAAMSWLELILEAKLEVVTARVLAVIM